jgi:RpiR family carbohydrate utilization transcriptional regulator
MLEKFTMAYMEQTNQLQCAKELDENSVAIILTVSGHIFNGNQKMISYIKKSNAKVVIITNDQDFDFGFEPDYVIGIGDPKYKRTGKHNLLTTMELMALRYYSIYYPDVKDNIIE